MNRKIIKKILKFRNDRDWEQFHNPKDLALAMGIEIGELQENFLWKSNEESYDIGKNNNEVKEEFADIIIFAILFAHECNIDIEKAILDKLTINEKKYTIEKSKGKNTKYNKL